MRVKRISLNTSGQRLNHWSPSKFLTFCQVVERLTTCQSQEGQRNLTFFILQNSFYLAEDNLIESFLLHPSQFRHRN